MSILSILTKDLDRRQRYAQYGEVNEEKRSIEDALRVSSMLLSLIEQEKLSEVFIEQTNSIKHDLTTRNAELDAQQRSR